MRSNPTYRPPMHKYSPKILHLSVQTCLLFNKNVAVLSNTYVCATWMLFLYQMLFTKSTSIITRTVCDFDLTVLIHLKVIKIRFYQIIKLKLIYLLLLFYHYLQVPKGLYYFYKHVNNNNGKANKINKFINLIFKFRN